MTSSLCSICTRVSCIWYGLSHLLTDFLPELVSDDPLCNEYCCAVGFVGLLSTLWLNAEALTDI